MTDTIYVNLTDPTLFGKTAAEDENDESVFSSYYVSRPEDAKFLSSSLNFAVLKAYRGEGKSAVLRMAASKIRETESIVVRIPSSSIAPSLNDTDSDHWTREWKRKLLHLLACEIGATIGFAWSDDAMSLVEEAEKNGFRRRSFVMSVVDRLKRSPVPITREQLGTVNPEQILRRYIEGKTRVWLFIDDLDDNFEDTELFRTKLGSFFSACRQIISSVPEICIRTAIRPNVWTVVRRTKESVSKADDYIIPLQWEREWLRSVLAKRIEGYLARNDKKQLSKFDKWDGPYREEKLIELVFQEKMEWGRKGDSNTPKYRHPWIVMSTLARLRPRWMIDLAKRSANQAHRDRVSLITLVQITQVLHEYGQRRIDDLCAEYRAYCPQLHDIIAAFSGQSVQYSTAELMQLINNRVLQGVNVKIAREGVTRALNVAALLYEIGFISARKDFEEGIPIDYPDGMYADNPALLHSETGPIQTIEYKHYMYADKPDLLHSRTNIDCGMRWEIHPVFHQALGLRDDTGRRTTRI